VGGAAPRGTVRIDAEACKGCELCIAVCPPSVLAMGDERNARGDAFPVLSPGCTACGRCVAVCPDFALTVMRVPAAEAAP
jgi:2-oxoglutarate ferredoxin oxidoreductase subunit delta